MLVGGAGVYTVTVTDANGCQNSRSAWFSQVQNPTIYLGPDTTICEGNTVVLDPGVFESYIWNDQTTDQTLTVTTSGTYYVSVIDANGCGAVDVIDITVLPISVDLGPDVILCPGETTTLDAPQFETYMWSNQETTQSITVNQTGTYIVTVTDSVGCQASDSVDVVPAQVPPLDLGTDISLCEGDQTDLFAGYFDLYLWSDNSTNQTLTVWQSGTYSVTCTTLNGCVVEDSVTVTVNPNPTVNIIGFDTSFCSNGDVIPLVGTPAGGNFSGPGVSQNMFNPGGVNPGQTWIQYSYTDGNGCSNETMATTTVYAAPVVSFTGLDAEYFSDDAAVQLAGTPTGGLFTGGNMQGNTFDPVVAGVGYHSISYEYTDLFGCSDMATQTTQVTTVYDIMGAVLYNNQVQSVIYPALVYLEDDNQAGLEFMANNADGSFLFSQYHNGTYYLSATTNAGSGGINATDALNIRRHVVMLDPLSGLNADAADVNGSGSITSADALFVLRKTVGYITTFPAGEWVFDHPQAIIANTNVTQNILANCFGDVNGSFNNNNLTKTCWVGFEKSGSVDAPEGELIELPVSLKTSAELGAITLVLDYPVDGYRIHSVESDLDNLLYHADNGQLRIAWENVDGNQFEAGESMMTLVLEKTPDFAGTGFDLGWETELADRNGTVLKDVVITMPEIGQSTKTDGFSLGHNFPNPFSQITHIEYSIPEKAHVRLSVKNMLGQEMEVLVDGMVDGGSHTLEFNAANLAAGVYTYKIEVTGAGSSYSASEMMQIIK